MIKILYNSNRKMLKGLILSIMSILKHNKEPLDIIILTMDLQHIKTSYKKITEEDRILIENLIKSVNKESSVKVFDMSNYYISDFGNKDIVHYTPYAILRLYIQNIEYLKNEEKILYLDCDTMVNKSLKPLLDINISEYELAAAKDQGGKKYFFRDFYNSGVLLINMVNCIKNDTFNKALEDYKKRKYKLPDQTAINRTCKSILEIDKIYNHQIGFNKNKTVIKHFCQRPLFVPPYALNIKQWEFKKVHKILKIHAFDDIFIKYKEIEKDFTSDKIKNFDH